MKDKSNKPAKKVKSLPPEQQTRFDELDSIVREAAKGVVDACLALGEIHRDELYKPKYGTFAKYCESVHNFSRSYGYRLMESGKAAIEMSPIVDTFGLTQDQIPKKESQLRELARVKNNDKRCEILAEVIDNNGPDYTAADLAKRVKKELEIEQENKPKKKTPTQRIEKARDDFDQLSELLAAYDYGADVKKLMKSLKKLLAE